MTDHPFPPEETMHRARFLHAVMVERLCKQRDEALAKVDAVRKLHQEDARIHATCTECATDWPCPTIRALGEGDD